MDDGLIGAVFAGVALVVGFLFVDYAMTQDRTNNKACVDVGWPNSVRYGSDVYCKRMVDGTEQIKKLAEIRKP